MARCMARRIRSGTLVGPGTNRKLRPGITTILDERGKTKREPAALASPIPLSYAATPAPQPYGWVGRGPPREPQHNPVRGAGGLRGALACKAPSAPTPSATITCADIP